MSLYRKKGKDDLDEVASYEDLEKDIWREEKIIQGERRVLSLGNNVDSLTLFKPSRFITRRSRPRPQPACGGIPYLNAFS